METIKFKCANVAFEDYINSWRQSIQDGINQESKWKRTYYKFSLTKDIIDIIIPELEAAAYKVQIISDDDTKVSVNISWAK